MQIVEVKNNLVKVSYDTSEETLVLSGFVAIKDVLQSFIGQIIHLEATSKGNFAIVKLFFNFSDDGVVTTYNGSAPDAKSLTSIVQSEELLELLPIQTPVIIGQLAQQKTLLKLDKNIFENKLLVCSEKEEDNNILTKNFVQQLATTGKKILVIDLSGNSSISGNKIIAGEDFKLPLNYETINFIYEKGLDDAKAETKALIQEIFLEVQDYVKTLPEQFIPFQTFKDVVDSQYEELDLIDLVLLKNKLLKYYEAGVFAQNNSEFDALKISIENEIITVLDLSKTDEKIQREMISYAYSLIQSLDKEIYIILNINNSNSDKKLLKQIFTTKNAYSTVICPYSYKYLKELKQISKDLILFAPIQQQDDFASYNTFLNKLNFREFVVYGQSTHHLPLIVKLEEIAEEGRENREQETEESSLDEEIIRDVDTIYTTPKTEQIGEEFLQEMPKSDDFAVDVLDDLNEEHLTDEDLDFIDDFVGINDAGNNETERGEEAKILESIDEAEETEMVDFEIAEEEPAQPFNPSTFQPAEETEIPNIELAEEETVQPFTPSPIQPIEPPVVDILPASMSTTPIVPIYSADIEPQVESSDIEQGDIVMHPKYGKGIVEKLINYGSKTLCSINFDNVGRRLLDPTLAEIQKVE